MFDTHKALLTYMTPLLLLCCATAISQVGINTLEPRKTLEVAGDVEINGDLIIGTVDPLDDDTASTFLIQETNNFIKTLDVSNPTSEALGYVQEYVITNMFEDFIASFDTQVNATDYVMVVISAYYNDELVLSRLGNGNPKESDHYSLPYTATFIEDNKWHLVANYPIARNESSSIIGQWNITTLIFSKDLSKQLGEFSIPMSGSSTGSDTTPIID